MSPRLLAHLPGSFFQSGYKMPVPKLPYTKKTNSNYLFFYCPYFYILSLVNQMFLSKTNPRHEIKNTFFYSTDTIFYANGLDFTRCFAPHLAKPQPSKSLKLLEGFIPC